MQIPGQHQFRVPTLCMALLGSRGGRRGSVRSLSGARPSAARWRSRDYLDIRRYQAHYRIGAKRAREQVCHVDGQESFRGGCAGRGCTLASHKGGVTRRFLAHSSPSRLPDPAHPVVLDRPVVVRAAPTLPGTTRIRLPSAPPSCCDRISGGGLSPPLEPQRLTAHPRPAPHAQDDSGRARSSRGTTRRAARTPPARYAPRLRARHPGYARGDDRRARTDMGRRHPVAVVGRSSLRPAREG